MSKKSKKAKRINLKEAGAVVALLAVAAALGLGSHVQSQRSRASGCHDGIMFAVVQQNGPVPPQFRDEVERQIGKLCSDALK